MGETAGGTGSRGDPAWTMGTGQTMGGRGVERSDSGVAEVEEREVGFKDGRKETATKEIKRRNAGVYPQVLGFPSVYSRTVRMSIDEIQTFPAWVLALFLAASPSPGTASEHPRLGRERPRHCGRSAPRVVVGVSHDFKQRSGPGKTEQSSLYPICRWRGLRTWSTGTLKAVTVPVAHSSGLRKSQATRRGHCEVRDCC